jgi:predicted RNA binding protein YcfA (HicA-like mRNA interferase family)
MPSRDFSGRDIVKVLRSFGYRPVDHTGSHVKLRYEHPTNDDDVRVVTVPLHDRVRTGTLQQITDQCGADDFHAWCEWIDDHA